MVLAKTWWSPELSSDRDDSESLVTGIASEDVDSSPYAGGAIARRPVFGRGNRSKDVVFLGSPDCDEAASPSEGSPAFEPLNGSRIVRLKLWLFRNGLGALANSLRFEGLGMRSSMSLVVGAVVMILGARTERG